MHQVMKLLQQIATGTAMEATANGSLNNTDDKHFIDNYSRLHVTNSDYYTVYRHGVQGIIFAPFDMS